MSPTLTSAFWAKLREQTRDAAEAREQRDEHARDRLRDMVAQLREPGAPHAYAPASTSTPTFHVGEARSFPHLSEPRERAPERGHLSDEAYKQFMDAMKDAAKKPDLASRDAVTGRAAKVVAQDWLHRHGHGHDHQSLKAELLHKFRAQVTFESREIGQKLGLGPVESMALGYSFERALEREGFRVLASHAVDRATELFRASASAVAGAAGMSASMERNLKSSMTWLAEHGVTREVFKDLLAKHSGKISALVEVAQHPEALRRAAQLIAHSDSALHAVVNLAKDSELRKAVGSLTLATGESMASGPGLVRAVGSVAVVAGSAMRGDSAEETGRHVFRAALTILGGAAGGIAGGAVSAGFGSVAGGLVGAEVGSRLADKLLSLYDGYTRQHDAQASQERSVGRDELKHSVAVIAERTEGAAAKEVRTHGLGDRAAEMEREFSLKTRPGKA